MNIQVFEKLHQSRSFEMQYFPFVDTIEDRDVLVLIGLHQERDIPFTLKQMLAFGIGTNATVERRLARFKRLGVVKETQSGIDRRCFELRLSAKTMRIFQRYANYLAVSIWED